MFRLAILLSLAVAFSGCADLDDTPGVTVRVCDACYYTNRTSGYRSLYFDSGAIVPVLPWERVDIEGKGSFTVHDGTENPSKEHP